MNVTFATAISSTSDVLRPRIAHTAPTDTVFGPPSVSHPADEYLEHQICGRQHRKTRWCALPSLNAIDSDDENGITPPQFILLRGEGTQQSTIDVLSDEEGSGVHSAGRTGKMIK